MVFAFFDTSSYVSNGKGPTSPGRWHGAQFLKMIGAMSSLNVGFSLIRFGRLQLAARNKHGSATETTKNLLIELAIVQKRGRD